MNGEKVKSHVAFSDETSRQSLTIDEVAYCSGTSRLIIQQLVEEELIVPCSESDTILFDGTVFARIRSLLRLHHHLGVDVQSLGLVIRLLDRIEMLEQELHPKKNPET